VLAAGSSSRLGSNKLLIELGGESLVRRAARRALEAGLSPVVVVLGFEAGQVAAAVEGLAVETVINPRHADGQHASVQAGVHHLAARAEAAVVVLADMPLVTPGMLTALVARYREGARIVTSRYGDVQAPPTLYAREFFPALSTAGPGCGRRVVREHSHLAAALDWPAELLADIDRPEDLARIGELYARSMATPTRFPHSVHDPS
jgi:molybdenum cofactor cytidylyltransferase